MEDESQKILEKAQNWIVLACVVRPRRHLLVSFQTLGHSSTINVCAGYVFGRVKRKAKSSNAAKYGKFQLFLHSSLSKR